jgi:hypothetical protein
MYLSDLEDERYSSSDGTSTILSLCGQIMAVADMWIE